MSSPRVDQGNLLAKPYLSIKEMTEVLAAAVGGLPSVRRVDMVDGEALTVSLVSGARIEVQTVPLAALLNGSDGDRRAIIDDVLKRCA